MRKPKAKQRASALARGLFVALLMFATLFPFYWTLIISLKNQNDAFQVPPDLFFMPTLENYQELFVTGNFGQYFFNSFVVCLLSIVLALVVVVLVYFLEIWIDNNFARVKWQALLASAWGVALVAGGVNIAFLAYL